MGALLLTVSRYCLVDSRSLFMVEMNWLKPILILLEGDVSPSPAISINCVMPEKKGKKCLPLFIPGLLLPFQSVKGLHTDDLDRINP